ncbi:MAG: DUF1178 family protein [Sphingomonadales bacterium]|nr:MAG: DUF1178 family protein [Sphingomonadales bacterium]
MIVFQLACDNAHSFEGWFRSSDDFASQQARGLVTCPTCDSASIAKAPMAPAVAVKGNRASPPAQTVANKPMPAEVAEAFKALAAAQAKALAKSEWVGDRFATEVRSMHYGETEEKQVHGRATKDDALSLMEEGIAVAPLLVPVRPPEELN